MSTPPPGFKNLQKANDSPAVEVPSPCVDICRLDPVRGLCEGCLRTMDEIAGWRRMGDAEKRAVLDRLPARRPPGS
jgi:uncharacterized protein